MPDLARVEGRFACPSCGVASGPLRIQWGRVPDEEDGLGDDGYTDNQVTPMMMGAVLLLVLAGIVSGAAEADVWPYVLFALACVMLGFGLAAHLTALEYPESPFVKHSSPVAAVVFTVLPLAWVAWRAAPTPYRPMAWIAALGATAALAAFLYGAWRRRAKDR